MKSCQHWWGGLCAGQFGYTLQFGEENKPFDIKSTQSLISVQEINKLPISLWSYAEQSWAALGNPRLQIKMDVGCRALETESWVNSAVTQETTSVKSTCTGKQLSCGCGWQLANKWEIWEREWLMLIAVGVKFMWTKYWTWLELHEGDHNWVLGHSLLPLHLGCWMVSLSMLFNYHCNTLPTYHTAKTEACTVSSAACGSVHIFTS